MKGKFESSLQGEVPVLEVGYRGGDGKRIIATSKSYQDDVASLYYIVTRIGTKNIHDEVGNVIDKRRKAFAIPFLGGKPRFNFFDIVFSVDALDYFAPIGNVPEVADLALAIDRVDAFMKTSPQFADWFHDTMRAKNREVNGILFPEKPDRGQSTDEALMRSNPLLGGRLVIEGN